MLTAYFIFFYIPALFYFQPIHNQAVTAFFIPTHALLSASDRLLAVLLTLCAR